MRKIIHKICGKIIVGIFIITLVIALFSQEKATNFSGWAMEKPMAVLTWTETRVVEKGIRNAKRLFSAFQKVLAISQEKQP